MSITTHRQTPCWEIFRPSTGYHPNEESWPHHETREKAEQEKAEWDSGEAVGDPIVVEVRQSFPAPCALIKCDGCGDALDGNGEGWTHFDPADPSPGCGWSDIEWTERGGKHYHDECAPPWCEDCEVEGHDVDDCPVATPSGVVA